MISYSSQATNTESNTETGIETEQVQMSKSSKKVIKKSIEKTEEATVITEYDQQGNIIKITDRYEFTFKDGKIISAKGGGEASINKQENSASYYLEGEGYCGIHIKFNEFGYKNSEHACDGANTYFNYEYNKDGLLVKMVEIYEDYSAGSSLKNTTTYTYDVMSQDWTKRTGKDNQGNKTVTTRTVEYW